MTCDDVKTYRWTSEDITLSVQSGTVYFHVPAKGHICDIAKNIRNSWKNNGSTTTTSFAMMVNNVKVNLLFCGRQFELNGLPNGNNYCNLELDGTLAVPAAPPMNPICTTFRIWYW